MDQVDFSGFRPYIWSMEDEKRTVTVLTSVKLRADVYQRWKASRIRLADLVEAGLDTAEERALLNEEGEGPEMPDVGVVAGLTRDATPSP